MAYHIYDPSDIKTNWIFLGDNNFDKGLNIIVLLSIIETFKSRNGDTLILRVANLWRYGWCTVDVAPWTLEIYGYGKF